MHPLEACVRNPVKISVGMLLISLFGFLAWWRMPMQLTPEVESPILSVQTSWPGRAPQDIEREIVQRQEEELKGVQGVVKMSSDCRQGEGRISLEFAVGTDISEALLKVHTRLQQVGTYPIEASHPVISTSNLSEKSIAIFVLTQRPPSEAVLKKYQAKYPQWSEPLASIARAANPGLALLRMRELQKLHPELAGLCGEYIDLTKLQRFSENTIEAQFERVNGVSDAEIRGGREEEVQILVDPQKLAARKLTIDNVRAALQGENKDTSAGDVNEGLKKYLVRTMAQFRNLNQIENVILTSQLGERVYLRDVAEIRIGYQQPDWVVRRYGDSAVFITAQREPGANVMDVMNGLKREMVRLNDGILRQKGLILTQVYDETDYIRAAMALVRDNLWVGGALTVITLLVFLRSLRTTLILAMAIPVSILGTFLVLDACGRSLNVISLAVLGFAVGMLVDNSVVVLENIFRHYELGRRPVQAAFLGVREVWGAVVASTLTTLAVFVPVLFVKEEAGQLFYDLALAISAAIGLSLVVSVTVVPAWAAKLLRRPQSSNGHAGNGQIGNGHARSASSDPVVNATQPSAAAGPAATTMIFDAPSWAVWLGKPFDWLGQKFVGLVLGTNVWLQRSAVRELAAVGLMTSGALFFSWLLLPRVEYLPNGNPNLVMGMLQPPPGYSFETLTKMGADMEQKLQKYWKLDPDSEEAKKLPYPPISDFFFIAQSRRVQVGMRSMDPARAAELVPLLKEITRDIPGTYVSVRQTSMFERRSGGGGSRSIDLEIRGPDLDRLLVLGQRVLADVQREIPGVQAFPRSNLTLTNPEVHVVPRPEQLKDLGLTSTKFGYLIDALVDGAYATDYYVDGEKIDVTILGPRDHLDHTQDLGGQTFATPTGDLMLVAGVAEVDLRAGPQQIERSERQRAVTLEVTPPENIPLELCMEMLKERVIDPLEAEGEIGGPYQIALAGAASKLRATWDALWFNFALALLITYLLMAALFESWLHPFVVILTVPLGAVGGIAALKLMNLFVNQPLDVLTMLGFVILIGTVVNNAILLVHQSLNHLRDDGMTPSQAILHSTRTRIRPIFMTTGTTVLGLLPLVLFPGAGSELYRGLGAVVLGGLIVSTVFTLILTPVLFHFVLRWKFLGGAQAFGEFEDEEPMSLTLPAPVRDTHTSPVPPAVL